MENIKGAICLVMDQEKIEKCLKGLNSELGSESITIHLSKDVYISHVATYLKNYGATQEYIDGVLEGLEKDLVCGLNKYLVVDKIALSHNKWDNDERYYLMKPEDYIEGLTVYVNNSITYKEEFEEEVLSSEMDLSVFFHMLRDGYGAAYIKYLDNDDIEDLGFEVKSVKGSFIIYLDGVQQGILFKNRILGNVSVKLANGLYNIKNKAEFKKLAQQLNLID